MSPRTPKQFQEIREEKMTLIMDVALEHFAKEGYFSTTINHIARHAGISKGLMYNYFDSKEALLKAIIHRSVNEIYKYLDINRDGYLNETEFEFFIRKIDVLLKEKKYFFRLLMQLLIQNDVKDEFPKAFPESDSFIHPGHEPGDNYYPTQILKMFTDYFYRKKEEKDRPYDPAGELEFFKTVMLGYSVKALFSADKKDDTEVKEIDKIIELFK
ncbi:MAG: TetR/AcrR family transcriptional regulator [Bacteroidales bacterium]|nr:TetR/AcrR family transcriptional regulator [Bacteroidales bacterium]